MAACTYVASFTHPDTRARLRYYGAAESVSLWLDCAPARLRELAEWFGADLFRVEKRSEFPTLAAAEQFARRLSVRLKLHLRPEWLNGTEYSGPSHLLGTAGDRRGARNPMHGRRHRDESRQAMSRAKQGRSWVYRGREARQVPADERERLLAAGWKPGRPR